MKILKIIICIALVGLSASLLSWAQPQSDHARYEALSRQVFLSTGNETSGPVSANSQVREDQVITQLHAMVQNAISAELSKKNISADSINRAISDLQGDESLGVFLPETKIPFADLSDVNGTSTLVTAFAIMNGGAGIPDVRPYIQFYSHVGGEWKMRAEVGSEFQGTAFSVASLQTQASGRVLYLVYGTTIGDTGARLKLRLYEFDGFSVSVVWKRDDLTGGTVSPSKNRIIINYFEKPPEGVIVPPREVTEMFKVSPDGLTKVSSSFKRLID